MPESRTRKKPRKKQPVEARCRVVLDDESLLAVEDAHQQLEQMQAELDASRERRVRLHMLNGSGGDLTKAQVEVDEEDEAQLAPLRETIEQAEKTLADNTETYVFRSIGRFRFNELVAEHPPTDDDIEEVRQQSADPNARPAWSFESFGPALISACAVEPKISLDEATEMSREWNEGEFLDLFTAALQVNQVKRSGDVGKAFGATRSAVR